MSNTQSVDLDSLDLTKASENGHEFEYIRSNGEGSGIFITVIGDHAPKVKEWTRKQLNKLRQAQEMAARKNRPVTRDVESDEEFFINQTAQKVISWRGIKQDCTYENVVKLITINPEIREQVNEAAKDLANFTKG